MNEDDTNQLQLEQLLNEAISTLAIKGETMFLQIHRLQTLNFTLSQLLSIKKEKNIILF